MPTFYADLDNTLADRAAAFRAWAVDFLAKRSADPTLIDGVVTADRDGLGRKQDTVDDITRLLGLDEETSSTLLTTFRAGIVERLRVVPGGIEALQTLRAAGWTIGIITNGTTRQQTAKIEALGLAPLVDGWVISEQEGVEKPDPRLFEIAAERLGTPLTADDWMIGDSAASDVAGAQAAGIRSIWLARGREWPSDLPRPTVIANSWPDAVSAVLEAGPG